MSLNQLNVAAPGKGALNTQPIALGGLSGETAIADLHPKYYFQSLNRNLFMGTTGAVTQVVASSATPVCMLWNPAGSGVNLVVAKIAINQKTAASSADGFAIANAGNLGSVIGGTGAPITAFTLGTVVSGLVGSGATPKANYCSAATLTAGGTIFFPLGLSTGTAAISTAEANANWFIDLEGMLAIAPGFAIVIGGGSNAIAGIWEMGCSWYEFPA